MSYSRERHRDPIPISDDGIGNRYAPRHDPRKREPTLQKLSGSAERRGSFEDIGCVKNGETIWPASCLEIRPQGAPLTHGLVYPQLAPSIRNGRRSQADLNRPLFQVRRSLDIVVHSLEFAHEKRLASPHEAWVQHRCQWGSCRRMANAGSQGECRHGYSSLEGHGPGRRARPHPLHVLGRRHRRAPLRQGRRRAVVQSPHRRVRAAHSDWCPGGGDRAPRLRRQRVDHLQRTLSRRPEGSPRWTTSAKVGWAGTW